VPAFSTTFYAKHIRVRWRGPLIFQPHVEVRTATVGGIGSGRSLGAASKCEDWRSIDLADLKRMGLLKPIVGPQRMSIKF
jgi:hypothetical protein